MYIHQLLVDSLPEGLLIGSFDCFLCFSPEQAVEQTIELSVICDVMLHMRHHRNGSNDAKMTAQFASDWYTLNKNNVFLGVHGVLD